jgi:hypothetical protein
MDAQVRPTIARMAARSIGMCAFVVLPFIASLTTGAERPRDKQDGYRLAVADGKAAIAAVRELVQIWPDARHSITHYTGEAGPTFWQSHVPLYGRYVLSVQIPITIDRGRGKVVGSGDPVFILEEIAGVKFDPATREETITQGDVNVTFGKAEWSKVVRAKGALDVLGVKIRKESPVTGFDAYFHRNFD